MMKPTAVLINAARGGLVDEDALARALAADRLRAAAIDAFAEEPLPASSPLRKLGDKILLSPTRPRSTRTPSSARASNGRFARS